MAVNPGLRATKENSAFLKGRDRLPDSFLFNDLPIGQLMVLHEKLKRFLWVDPRMSVTVRVESGLGPFIWGKYRPYHLNDDFRFRPSVLRNPTLYEFRCGYQELILREKSIRR